MKLRTHAETVVLRAPAAAFDHATAGATLVRIAKALPPIPGITGVEVEGELRTGAVRHVRMTDGSVVDEDILAHDAPTTHRYRWQKKPAFPFSLMVATGEGVWTFTPEGAGTKVAWDYEFDLTSPLAYPLAALVLRRFEAWMQAGLEALRAELA